LTTTIHRHLSLPNLEAILHQIHLKSSDLK